MFARVLGPYLMIAMAVFAARTPDLRDLFAGLTTNPLVPWVAGAFTLLTGLVIVALHTSWDSAAAAIVSLLGVLTTIKGFAIMAFPGSYVALADAMTAAPAWLMAGAAVVGFVGLYLTYVGWIRGD